MCPAYAAQRRKMCNNFVKLSGDMSNYTNLEYLSFREQTKLLDIILNNKNDMQIEIIDIVCNFIMESNRFSWDRENGTCILKSWN